MQAKTTGAESPTTARPLEMDDDDVQETQLHQTGDQPSTSTTQATSTVPPTMENAPPKPPRPVSAQQEAEKTLKEAFPGVEAAVIKAVLIASGGKIEPAFNALLGMTDPEHAAELIEEPAPPQPPRPSRGGAPMSQLEADELYARQLAQHYDATNSANRSRSAGDGRHPQNGQHIRPQPRYQENDDYNFIDDELPVIKENLRKGFLETQSKVNGWITNLKKRIDGDDIGEINAQQQRHAQGGYQNQPGMNQQGYNQRRSGDAGRRSGDYDADPTVLSDDFAGINMNDDDSELHHVVNPRTSSLPNANVDRRNNRPTANPDLFKAQPAPPRGSGDVRRVSFQDPSENDLYSAPPVPRAAQSASPAPAGGKQSKWQPLSSVEPTAMRDEENDPFSLGDSDDEREAKAKDEAKVGGSAPAAAGTSTAAAPPAPTVGEDVEGKKLA